MGDAPPRSVYADRGGTAIGNVQYLRPTLPSQPVRLMSRPVDLVGREGLLADLDVRLTLNDRSGPQVMVLCGLGGAGKTSMAVEYGHRHLSDSGVVWQFQAEDRTALSVGFGHLAAQLSRRDLLDAGDPVAQVHGALAAYPGEWLLIFDNAPGWEAVQGKIPPAGRGRVLITSQNSQWPGSQTMEVPALRRNVAARFLQSRTGSASQTAARELADELGGLPLALEQAAAYMRATGLSISEYLILFQQRRGDLLTRGEPTRYAKQVATTWTLAFDELQQTAPSAIGLLRLLAWYAPEQIPLRLLLQPLPNPHGPLPEELASLLDDPLTADDAVASLRRFSLVSQPQNGLISVHRLVQTVTRSHLSPDHAESWRQAAQLLIEAALPADADQPGNWPAFAALLPHAQLTLPPDGDRMTRIADYLGHSGNYAAARDLQRQIVDALQRSSGNEHPGTLMARAGLAYWTGWAGDPATARDQYATLLPISERVLGGDHPFTLVGRAGLAFWTGEAGDPAAARDQYAALLPVRHRVLGAEHPDTLTARAGLAYWTGETGEPAAARDQYAALLPVSERVASANHPFTLAARAGLAYWTGEAGDSAAARDQFTTLMTISERVLGQEHPDTLTARAGLAYWTGEAGDPAAARDQFTALLSTCERVASANHPSARAARAGLAYWTEQAQRRGPHASQ
jgi:Tetratricopeptide repeat